MVRDIRFRGASAPDVLLPLLAQKPDEPLDRNKIRRSLQALYATGRFSELQVEAEPAPQNQITLVFVAKENYFIGMVSIGDYKQPTPSINQLVNAAKLELGQLYTDEKLKLGLARMEQVLADNGFYRATIQPERTWHRDTRIVDVGFHVHAGQRARVGPVTSQGDSGLTEEELRAITHLPVGATVTADRTRKALQRLRKHYQKRDRLAAQVSLVGTKYDPAHNTVSYAFTIDRGPTVAIDVEGARLSHGTLKRLVPVYEENAVDEDLLNEGRRNIRDFLETQGYFDTTVTVRQQSVPEDRTDVVYVVDKGKRHKLVGIEFRGNKYFDEDTLRERMSIQTGSVLMPHGRFSQPLLARDVAAIEDLYRANGFQQVKVTPTTKDDYHGHIGHIVVILNIEEGSQTLVSSLKIEGNKAFSDDVLRSLINTTEGQPFSDANVTNDHDSVVSYYYNHGFPNVAFDSQTQPVRGQPNRMDVVYKITEGPQIYVAQLITEGLVHTKPFIVDRALRIHPGDPLGQAAILDSQRRLYDMGVFNQVNFAVENPEGDERSKNLILDLEEARRWTFIYGVGFEVQTGSAPGTSSPTGRTGASPRVSLEITRLNFRGRDHTIIFKSRYGRLEKLGLFSYEAPHWLNHESLKLRFTTYYDDTRDVRTFTAQRLEGSLEAEHKVSNITTLLYRFSYRNVKVDPRTLVIDPALIPLFSKPTRIGMPSLTFIRDTRDDPINSHKGMYTTADVGVSSGIFGSEANFSRFLFQNSSYYAFGKRKQWVVARTTRVGVEEPYGMSGAVIPLPERFYAGGGNTQRGFAINQAGPRDPVTGFPLGGEGLFINQTELRLPPIALPFFGDTISPVLFHDMGNVYTSAGDIFPSLVRLRQPNEQSCRSLSPTAKCSFNYNPQAVGAGIRYKTPIGPVRLDFGYDLNPPLFPIQRESRIDRLAHFNFYFSIGQTF